MQRHRWYSYEEHVQKQKSREADAVSHTVLFDMIYFKTKRRNTQPEATKKKKKITLEIGG